MKVELSGIQHLEFRPNEVCSNDDPGLAESELPRPIKIRPLMYVRRSIMYEKAAFCSPEKNSSVAR